MTKEIICNKIKCYSNVKLLISIMLLFSLIGMVISLIVYSVTTNPIWGNIGLFSYALMILFVIFASLFPLNKPLKEEITLEDYRGILEFFVYMSDDITKQQYYDALIMTKWSLNITVYYHIIDKDIKDTLRKHLCYMQGVVFRDKNKNSIPLRLLNKTYFKRVCNVLLEQVNKNDFNEEEIGRIVPEEIKKEKKPRITITKLLDIVLIIIVVIKISITLNDGWYQLAGTNIVIRILYNTSVDVIAMVVAIIAWKRK